MKLLSNLPTSWESVTVQQFKEIRTIPTDLTFFERQKEIIFIMSDFLIIEEDIDEMDIEEFNSYFSKLNWLKYEPSNSYKEFVDEYRLFDINRMKLAEFLDFQTLLTQPYENLELILGLAYRKHILNEFGNPKFEPFSSYNIYERGNTFLDKPISDVYGVLNEIIKFKEKIYNDYQHHFNPIFEDEEMVEELDELEQEEIKQEELYNHWGWEKLIYDLAGGDLTKLEDIYNTEIITIFNFLSMKKDLNL